MSDGEGNNPEGVSACKISGFRVDIYALMFPTWAKKDLLNPGFAGRKPDL